MGLTPANLDGPLIDADLVEQGAPAVVVTSAGTVVMGHRPVNADHYLGRLSGQGLCKVSIG